jgi:hypothetical protein
VFDLGTQFVILPIEIKAGPGEQLESINELLVSLADRDIDPFLLE